MSEDGDDKLRGQQRIRDGKIVAGNAEAHGRAVARTVVGGFISVSTQRGERRMRVLHSPCRCPLIHSLLVSAILTAESARIRVPIAVMLSSALTVHHVLHPRNHAVARTACEVICYRNQTQHHCTGEQECYKGDEVIEKALHIGVGCESSHDDDTSSPDC